MQTIYQSIRPLTDPELAAAEHAAARRAFPPAVFSVAVTHDDLAALEERMRLGSPPALLDMLRSQEDVLAGMFGEPPASSPASSEPPGSVHTPTEERPRGLGRRLVDALTGGEPSATSSTAAAEVADDAGRGE